MAGTHGTTLKLRNVNVLFGGAPALDRPEGAFITINYLADQVTMVGGIDSAMFVESDDLRAEVLVRVMQHSPTNAIYSAFHTAKLAKSLMIAHIGGADVFTASHAKIGKWPSVVYSNTGEAREWLIRVPRLVPFIGGIPPEVVV